MDKITVGWMYPNLLNLHGERGSIQALSEIGKKMGVSVEIIRIEDFDDPIPYQDLDLIVFLPGEREIMDVNRFLKKAFLPPYPQLSNEQL